MLRKFFPSTNEGAQLYKGSMIDTNNFFKIFEMKGTLASALKKINIFLDQNGYDKVSIEDFNEENVIDRPPILISEHAYNRDQLVLYIDRDEVAESQIDFIVHILKSLYHGAQEERSIFNQELGNFFNYETGKILEGLSSKLPKDVEAGKAKLSEVVCYILLTAKNLDLNLESLVLQSIAKKSKEL